MRPAESCRDPGLSQLRRARTVRSSHSSTAADTTTSVQPRLARCGARPTRPTPQGQVWTYRSRGQGCQPLLLPAAIAPKSPMAPKGPRHWDGDRLGEKHPSTTRTHSSCSWQWKDNWPCFHSGIKDDAGSAVSPIGKDRVLSPAVSFTQKAANA